MKSRPPGRRARIGDGCVSHVARNYDAMQSSLGDFKAATDAAGPGSECDADVAFLVASPAIKPFTPPPHPSGVSKAGSAAGSATVCKVGKAR